MPDLNFARRVRFVNDGEAVPGVIRCKFRFRGSGVRYRGPIDGPDDESRPQPCSRRSRGINDACDHDLIVDIPQGQAACHDRAGEIFIQRCQIQDVQVRNPGFEEHAVEQAFKFDVVLHARKLRLVPFLNARPVDTAEPRIEILLVDCFPDDFESFLPVARTGLLCKSVADEDQEENRSANNNRH